MDEGRFFCDAKSSRNSLTWTSPRTPKCCPSGKKERAGQTDLFAMSAVVESIYREL
jgi:hypothetical protein